MSWNALDHLIAASATLASAHPEPVDCVTAIAPLMQGLPAHAARVRTIRRRASTMPASKCSAAAAA